MRGPLESWSVEDKGKNDMPDKDVVWVVQLMSRLSKKLFFCSCFVLGLTDNNWKMDGEQLCNGDVKTACIRRREERPTGWPVWDSIER